MLTLHKYSTGEHARYVDGPGFRLWFSYRTPVAFWVAGKGLTVRENDWGSTTGRHLAAIERAWEADGTIRISGEDFEARLTAACPPDFSCPLPDGPDISHQPGRER